MLDGVDEPSRKCLTLNTGLDTFLRSVEGIYIDSESRISEFCVDSENLELVMYTK